MELHAWMNGSCVTDDSGQPLMVYRGEHGDGDWLHTRLGSYSFGGREAANTYALQPNHRDDTLHAPRILPAYLRITKPFVNQPDDAFIDFSTIIEALGRQHAHRLALKFADAIANTNNWYEIMEETGLDDLAAFLDQYPERLGELYCEVYYLLDDPDEVALIKSLGFDGAIHCGSGETFDDVEYKVFSPDQVWSVTAGRSFALDAVNSERLVWHGSPYEFERFSVEHIGSGEKGADFGWGLYFSDEQDVARDYTGDLGLSGAPVPRLYSIKGESVTRGSPAHKAADLILDIGLAKARKFAASMLEDARQGLEYTLDNGVAWYEALVEVTQSVASKRDVKHRKGSLYPSIIPKDALYLAWDLTVGDQPEAVRQVLSELMPGEQSMTGERWYIEFARACGGRRQASEKLLDSGVAGVVYRNRHGRSNNYVMFDAGMVRMATPDEVARHLAEQAKALQLALEKTAAECRPQHTHSPKMVIA